MLNFNFSVKGLGLVSPPHFVNDFSRKFCLMLHSINEIPVVFHNGSNYDYHFITKELANEFEGQFKCLGEIKKITKLFYSNRKRSYKYI